MRRFKEYPNLAGLIICAGLVIGCSSSSSQTKSEPPTATATVEPSSASTSTGGLATSELKIYYEENAQVELVGPTGRRVLIDVWMDSMIAGPVDEETILLTTHQHGDHYNPVYVAGFPGRTLTFETGSINLDDVTITSIASRHDEAFEDGSDYIFVIDMAGLRIVHFGDLGADKLTDEQLAKIGRVDIAFSQLENAFSSMDSINRKGFNQMNQVKPRLLIPTHVSAATVEMAASEWIATYANSSITMSKEKLPAAITVCFMGAQASSYATLYNLQPAGW